MLAENKNVQTVECVENVMRVREAKFRFSVAFELAIMDYLCEYETEMVFSR